MATSPEFAEYILDQMSESGDITSRKMFGGVGVSVDGIFCAIISSKDVFYLRVGPENLGDFLDQEMEQFPGGKGKGMPYYEVPESAVEDKSQLSNWCAKAKAAAIAAKK